MTETIFLERDVPQIVKKNQDGSVALSPIQWDLLAHLVFALISMLKVCRSVMMETTVILMDVLQIVKSKEDLLVLKWCQEYIHSAMKFVAMVIYKSNSDRNVMMETEILSMDAHHFVRNNPEHHVSIKKVKHLYAHHDISRLFIY